MGRNEYISVVLPLRLGWLPCYSTEEPLARGERVKVRFAGREYVGVVWEVWVRPETDPSKVQPVMSREPLPPVTECELKLWEFVSSYYLCSIGEVYKAAYPVLRIEEEETARRMRERVEAKAEAAAQRREEKIRKLEARLEAKKVLIEKARTPRTRDAYQEAAGEIERQLAELLKPESKPAESSQPVREVSLSPAQQIAKNEIDKYLQTRRVVLLNGITGSGKTEIYLAMAKEQLARGKNVLYLVPEIALSRQLEDRLRAYFGQSLLTFHSAETSAHRREVASALSERPYVVLGTRSAIFLPHGNLGLVIVDEEHDGSYKQDSPAPRYQGRDTAVVLASIHGAKVVLGSATPSMESLYNCHTGLFAKVDLKERFYAGGEADVEIIDTIAERRKRGMSGSLSLKLIAHMRKALDGGGQVVLLRGRRAYSPIVQCDSCGDIPHCPHCNIALSYHKPSGRLVCHYCGFSAPFSGKCGKCGGNLLPVGAGTQRIEEEVAALFPDVGVARLDGDTSPAQVQSVIRSFAAGETRILVGTQMVSKGFDFEGLNLVAVIAADTLVGQQDFRADERAVQLLEQFRGRCGRRGKKGLFVIQTARPTHPVYAFLRGEETDGNAILEERREFGYPPFTRIVKLILRDTSEERLDKLAARLSSRLCSDFGISPTLIANPSAAVSLTGPYKPSPDRIAGKFIRHIRFVIKRDKNLTRNKQQILTSINAFEKETAWTGHVSIDVDPL